MRRISLVLGLAAASVGALLFERAHSMVNGCSLAPASQGGFGADPGCATQVWVGYAGFALVVAGLMVAALALVVMRRRGDRVAVSARRERSLLGTPGERRPAEAVDPTVVRPLRTDPGTAASEESRPPSAA